MNKAIAPAANKIANKIINKSAVATTGGGSSLVAGILLLLLAIFVVILLVFLIQYLRSPCGRDDRTGFWEYARKLDPSASACLVRPPVLADYVQREKKDEEEAWNISDQVYTYPEAREKCKAYGARLATKQDLIKAYNNGAQWTNYGWSEGGEAYYPIQPCEFVRLRREGVAIGPPGVNGGRFEHHMRFGANCYGVKPPGEIVEPKSDQCPYPKVCQRNEDACKVLKNDHIAPFFPHKQWSQWDQ